MDAKDAVLQVLNDLKIKYELFEHPPLPTIEMAMAYWKDIDAVHCKNLFFRNHKGNRHYLVVFACQKQLNIRDLELRLKQGKLSFASEKRMLKYLGVLPGNVSPFTLINDTDNHVRLFLDQQLSNVELIAFHPNDNRFTVSLEMQDFMRYVKWVGNEWNYSVLYE